MPWYSCDIPSENVLSLSTVSNSVSGSLVNFNTSLALPLVALKTAITAQGGGGTPSAPVAITGFSEVNVTRAGKNLFNPVDITIGTIENNKWVITGSGGSRKAIDFIFKPNTQYTFSGHEVQTVANKNSRLRVVYTDDTVVNIWTDNTTDGLDFSYTSNASKSIKEVVFDYSSASGSVEISNLQLEFGSTVTAYEEYNGDIFTLPLGQTVYGGYVDCINGTGLKKCVKLTLDGNISTSDLRITAQTGYTRVEWYPYRDIGKGNENFKSDKFEFNTETGLYRVSNYNSTTTPRMFFGLPDSVTTREDAISWFASNPTEIVYELATPIPFSVTPTTMPQTIEGVQNWFADSGDIELSYWQTIKDKLGI